jgi:hypothetical protein
MTPARHLDNTELDALARIAERRGASVSLHVADRLLNAGLIAKIQVGQGPLAELALTSAGLAVIHSSDQ